MQETHVLRIIRGDVLGVIFQLGLHLLGHHLEVLLAGNRGLLGRSAALTTTTSDRNASVGCTLVGSRSTLHIGRDAVLGGQVAQNLVFGAENVLGVFGRDAGRVGLKLLLDGIGGFVEVLSQSATHSSSSRSKCCELTSTLSLIA